MKKIFSLVFIITVFAPILCFGQGVPVQKVEGGFLGGITLPVGSYHGSTPEVSICLGGEMRFNIKETPFDCGWLLEITSSAHAFNNKIPPEYFGTDIDVTQTNNTFTQAATFHYNFRQGRKVNPFAGCAVGLAINSIDGREFYFSEGTSIIFIPRFGVEFFRHMRLTCQFNLSRAGYNNAELTLGVCFGGRPKK